MEWNALKLIGNGGKFLDEKSVQELNKLYDKNPQDSLRLWKRELIKK